MLKIVKNEDSYIIRSFFHSFFQNIRQSTIIWLLLLVTGSLVSFDYYICTQSQSSYAKLLQTLLFFIGLVILATTFYVFPVLARFDSCTRHMLKNAFLMTAAHLPSTTILFLIHCGPALLMLRYPIIMIGGIYFYLFIGIGITSWLDSLLLRRILDKYIS